MTANFYRAFEDRYRGSRELIKERLQAYLPFIQPLYELYPAAPAVDLGCGRGEWLEILVEAGFSPIGVDLDEGMLDACHDLSLPVYKGEAIEYLVSLADNSQAVVSALHVVEHINFENLKFLVSEALRVLKPGGLLILETPNPENIVVATCNFYLDPTHQRPIPPALLSFVPEYYGFKRVKTIRLQESRELAQRDTLSLQDVFQGASPDYAVVAQKIADPAVMMATAAAFDREYGLTIETLSSRYDNTTQLQIQHAETKAQQAETKAQQAETKAQQAELQISALRERYEKLGQAFESRLQQIENRVRAVESKGIKTTLKKLRNKILRPLLLMADRFLQPHRYLKQRISFWLFRKFPNIHIGLRLLRQQQVIMAKNAQHTMGEQNLREMPAALSDPDLANLELPVNFESESSPLFDNSRDSETLEPVFELGQMRLSNTSVCFVVPIHENDRTSLECTVQSVLRQTDPAWEIILVAPRHLQVMAEEWLDIDWRIRRLVSPAESDEIQNTLQATIQATAQFMGILTQGDIVDDDLLKRIGQKVRVAPLSDVIYTDEICHLGNSLFGEPFYKPDWSPEHQCSVNMLGRFLAIRKSLLLNLRLSGSGAPEAREYEFALAVTRQARHIAHIDDALYIRHVTSQVRLGGFFPSTALDNARGVLERHLQEENPEVRVVAQPDSGSLHVRWPIQQNFPVTLLILTGMQKREVSGRGEVILATNFVRSIIEKSTFTGYRIIVVDDGFVPDDLQALLHAHGHTTHTYPKEATFSFARKANFATSLVTSGIAILLNDDLEVISNDWIEALASQVARPAIGAAGGKLLFVDGTLQHAGIALGFNGAAGHMFHRTVPDGQEYAGFASIERNYSAVTGAVLAYRKEVFDELGGFDERFQTDYNDLDFCLKCVKHGYRVVYTPAAMLCHFHNSSFKRRNDKESERKAFLDRWKQVVDRDPYFSKHFQTKSHDLPLLPC